MPCYVYECDNCHDSFEMEQGYHDKPLKKCKACGKHKLYKVPQVPHTFVYQPPKTLGHLADKNRDRMSEDEKHAIDPDAMQRAKVKENAKYDVFGKKVDKDLFKMTPKQMKEYVKSGKKPDFEGFKNEIDDRRKRDRSRGNSNPNNNKRTNKGKVL